jgi:hypothetical protein
MLLDISPRVDAVPIQSACGENEASIIEDVFDVFETGVAG